MIKTCELHRKKPKFNVEVTSYLANINRRVCFCLNKAPLLLMFAGCLTRMEQRRDFLKVRGKEIPFGIPSEKTIGGDSNLLPARILDDLGFLSLNLGGFFNYYYCYL